MTELTQNQLLELLTYNAETGAFRWRNTARNVVAGQVAGSMNWAGYITIKIKSKIYRAHRLAWLAMRGELPRSEIDHINGDRQDNRINNLRLADKSQNGENRRSAQCNNSTGLMGASPHKASGKFQAQIMTKGKKVHLGLFQTANDASDAYVTAKRVLHGFCTI